MKIAILQRVCTSYRASLFQLLSAKDDVDMHVFFGDDLPNSKVKSTKKLLALSEVPSCERKNKPVRLAILRWHRPMIMGSNRAPIIDRICIKLGLLRKSGVISGLSPV